MQKTLLPETPPDCFEKELVHCNTDLSIRQSLNKKSIIVSHAGKQHSYYVAKALQDLGYLKKFYTSSYITNFLLQKMIERFNLSYLSRRFLSGLGGGSVDANWKYEIREQLYRKIKGSNSRLNELVFNRDIRFDKDLARKILRQQFDVFWGFQGSCLESLKVSNKKGLLSVCEMTIAHLPFAQKLLDEEAQFHPEWADGIDFSSFPPEYEARLIEEPEIATHIIAISSFLKQTLVSDGFAPEKITVIPLGFDIHKIKYVQDAEPVKNRPLRLLFAGRVTQRKGIKYLLDAIKRFHKKDVELYIIGNIHGSGAAFRSYSDWYSYQKGVSQNEIFQLYANYDALVFPSLLEGFGLVTVEAMGAGLPVITTPNTNAAELIKDSKNGFVVPVRDTEAIASAIQKLRDMDDASFQEMRHQARASALNYTWEVHKDLISHFITGLKN
jgi:starch synthase